MLAQNLQQIQAQAGINAPTDVGLLFAKFLPFVYYGAGILFLIYLSIGGLKLMISRGDPKGVASAQSQITFAFFGFILVIVAYFATKLIGQIFGITVFDEIFRNGGFPNPR